MSSKNVELIVKYYLPVTAGIEVNMSETYSKLVEKDWNITVHTSTDSHTEKDVLPKDEKINGINVKRYVYGMFGFFPNINWDKADFVCLHNFNVFPHFLVMLYVIWLKLLGKKRFSLFLTPHGGFNPEWSVFSFWTRILKEFYHNTVGTFLINYIVDGVRAVSNWEREEMTKKGLNPNKIVVIDNGIEDEAYLDLEKTVSQEFKEKVAKYGKYIIQVGRVYVIKNYETTLRALAKTPSDLKYLIVGSVEKNNHAEYKQYLENLIKELGLQDRVIFTGVVKGADKFYLIKQAQMMVHMALWESFCNVVHEGLSQGLICIVANNTALPYLIKDGVNGYCVDTKDSAKVAEKINYVLANKNTPEMLKMSEINRASGLQNSWRDVSDRMYKFYNLVSEGRINEFID